MTHDRAHSAISTPFDLVVFWKQNDSEIYGRRCDHMVNQLSRSPYVAQTISFDAPICRHELDALSQLSDVNQGSLVHDTTLQRSRGLRDEQGITRRTLILDDAKPATADIAQRFGEYVDQTLKCCTTGSRPRVFWVYPTNPFLPELIDRFQPALTVADIVDDNRSWYAPGSPEYVRLSTNYRETLLRSDVVIANCEGVRSAVAEFRDDVEIVANGFDTAAANGVDSDESTPVELRQMSGPIVGYVGNLSARIDLGLLEHVAARHPDWNIVLIGSTHAGTDALRLAALPNVSLLGPRRHAEAARYIAAFDVALIPHVDDAMTRAMQPLKAFVYCGLGVPVVSTHIANLGAFDGMITVAPDRDGFVAAIEEALDCGMAPLTEEVRSFMAANSWEVRAEQALELVVERLR